MFSPASSPRGPAAGAGAGGGAGTGGEDSPARSKQGSVLSLDPVDTRDDGGGGICSDPISSNQSVCGVWLPSWFGGGSADQPPSSAEEAESIIESILTATVLPNYAERVLPQLEVLLDKHGIESVVYLPAKSGGQQPVGKKCMIRSYMDQARVEFRVRSAGELKKMKFDWGDIEEMGAGKYADATPATATPTSKKNQANCYMYIKIRDRGTVDLRFESKALRDATIMGFKLLQVKRQGKLA